MYIRTQQEALDAVAALLALSERREQIIQSTVAIMKCVESEPRHFLADCQALLLEDGLEGLKRKRREIFDQLHEQEVVAVLELGSRARRVQDRALIDLGAGTRARLQ